jgi:flagellar assembly protein FliH
LSKIYRSLDLQQTKVNEVNLRERAMGSQHPERPQGGFYGCQSGEAPAEPLSHLERRQRAAEQEAARLVEEARRQADQIQADAYREGFAQGERAGEKLALQKAEPVVQALQDLINAVQLDRANLIRMHEQDLVKVAFAIATQVLKTTIELQPETLRSVVDAALEKTGKAQDVTLKISSYDFQLMDLLNRTQGAGAWPPPHVKIEPDEAIGRGGCRIETELGDIDATIETQLRVMKNALWNE